MENPIYETSMPFYKIFLYPNRLVVKEGLLKKESTIYLQQIASIYAGMATMGRATIETTSGQKFKVQMWPKDKAGLLAAIEQARSKS